MQGLDLFGQHIWNPFNSELLILNFNAETIAHTWIAIAIIAAFCLLAKYFVRKKNSIVGHMAKKFVISFMDLTSQSLGQFSYNHFAYFTSLFLFIIFCNWISLIPELEEPTKDLNTTLALAVTTFIYIQIYAIKALGLKNYIKEFFSPFAPMFLLNIVGEIASIMSLSFRLFGNIFGGYVISGMYHKAVSGSIILHFFTTILALPLIINVFFILFEGFLQAFVFSILSLTNLAMALGEEE